ncbi:MAG: extracellular solute-binding protein [Geminicoccaceae bacterium]|nr:extracellular solute-binding protein [Geminicoccaceae bacterium]
MPTADRRTVLKGSAAAASLLAAPAILRGRDALASSGTLNVFAWGDYVQAFQEDGIVKAFEDETGTKVNLSTYASNEEAENKLRAAGGEGFDVLFPSVDTGPNYYKDGLLHDIDEAKLDVALILPALYRNSVRLGATNRGGRYLVPFDWGTEAMTWDGEAHPDLGYGKISYGDMFKDGVKAAMRQKSILASVALYLDATGELKSDRGMDAYKSEDECRRVFEGVTAFIAAHKANLGAYWNNATEATSAFTDAGCTIGQTWDTTGILLHRDVDPKWRYTMPVEGGLAWMDTVAIPKGAANVEGSYAFINHLLTPQMGATFSNRTGYNSCAVGAAQYLSEDAKAAFQAAYPDDAAIENLWWWPIQTPFYADLRAQYVEKMTNA